MEKCYDQGGGRNEFWGLLQAESREKCQPVLLALIPYPHPEARCQLVISGAEEKSSGTLSRMRARVSAMQMQYVESWFLRVRAWVATQQSTLGILKRESVRLRPLTRVGHSDMIKSRYIGMQVTRTWVNFRPLRTKVVDVEHYRPR
jgi:hypothetical protein